MTSSTKADLQALEQRLARAREALRSLAPEALAEYELLRELLDRKLSDLNKQPAPYLSRQRAIELLLTEHGIWMSKSDIAYELEHTGFIKSKSERGVLNTTLNYHVEKGNLQCWGDDSGWGSLIGLPGWPPPDDEQY